MSGFINLVCDYKDPGDLAWSEILSALADEIPSSVRLIQTCVDSFDTVGTGFTVAQLARRARKSQGSNLLFVNCAPRRDNRSARSDNEGEGLVHVTLDNNAEILAVNSGFSLSFVKPYIKKITATKASAKGSQFRSRDNFPSVLAKCLAGDYGFLGDVLTLDAVPDAPPSAVAYLDSFGNIKTSIRTGSPLLSSLSAGNRVRVIIGNTVRYATVTGGSFSVPEGELAFAPGSSGYEAPYWELFKRGGSAWSEFGGPKTGSNIEVELAAD
ncbi:MAG: hypothetical protein SGJ27_24640 [Candidatus Melainabacteria bacterium]|nr:hypothetical protein [Candidatus Melainabacteria bacterium]